jgi:hypothetical protein
MLTQASEGVAVTARAAKLLLGGARRSQEDGLKARAI